MGVRAITDELHGGCFCGNVRYQITGEPVIQLFCYCADCRAITGTEGWAGYMVKERDFRVIRGTPGVHEKVSKEHRTVRMCFCGNCGSSMY